MNEASDPVDPIVIEVRLSQWTGRSANGTFVVDLQRDDLGNLTSESRTELAEALQKLKPSTDSSLPCYCLLSGSGVSLRTLEMPPIKGGSIRDMIELQIESEWPLPLEELVWGYDQWQISTPNGASTQPVPVTIAAIKKTLFQQYDEIVRSSGFNPTWTLSAFAGALVREVSQTESCWLLEARPTSAELVEFESGHAKSIRQLPKLATEGTSSPEELATALPSELVDDPEMRSIVLAANERGIEHHLDSLERSLPGREIHSFPVPDQPGASLAREVFYEHHKDLSSLPHVTFHTNPEAESKPKLDRGVLIKWGALAVLLILALLLTRRIEPALRGESLRQQLATFNKEKKRLPEIDRELGFLSHLQERNLPFQDLIGLLAANTASGFEIRSLEMGSDRRIQIQGTLPQRAQPEDLRAKLFETAWFEQVVLDEQTPNKQERKLNVRISLTLKPTTKRPKLTREQLGLPKLAQESD